MKNAFFLLRSGNLEGRSASLALWTDLSGSFVWGGGSQNGYNFAHCLVFWALTLKNNRNYGKIFSAYIDFELKTCKKTTLLHGTMKQRTEQRRTRKLPYICWIFCVRHRVVFLYMYMYMKTTLCSRIVLRALLSPVLIPALLCAFYRSIPTWNELLQQSNTPSIQCTLILCITPNRVRFPCAIQK